MPEVLLWIYLINLEFLKVLNVQKHGKSRIYLIREICISVTAQTEPQKY